MVFMFAVVAVRAILSVLLMWWRQRKISVGADGAVGALKSLTDTLTASPLGTIAGAIAAATQSLQRSIARLQELALSPNAAPVVMSALIVSRARAAASPCQPPWHAFSPICNINFPAWTLCRR